MMIVSMSMTSVRIVGMVNIIFSTVVIIVVTVGGTARVVDVMTVVYATAITADMSHPGRIPIIRQIGIALCLRSIKSMVRIVML